MRRAQHRPRDQPTKENPMSATPTFAQLTLKYLAWCGKNRSPRTLEWYGSHLSGFLAHLGDDRDLPVSSLKPFHVVEWVDGKETWGDTYKRGAIVAVQRCLNWAEELGYIEGHALKKVKKPPAGRRDNPMMPEDFAVMLAGVREGDPFRDLFLFLWHSGARPQEARHIEHRHVQAGQQRIVIPKEEAKGKRYPRIIYLHGPALEIIERLMAIRPDGKLFLNTRGEPWTKYALCNRLFRLSQATGVKKAAYDARHGFCQRLLEKNVNLTVVSELMGHRNAQMVSSVYSHMSKATSHLHEALRMADGDPHKATPSV
jgi:integrase